MANATVLDIETQRLHALKDIGGGMHAETEAVVSYHATTITNTLTRTADTNAYTAGDVVGSSVSSGGGVLTFTGLGPPSGGAVMITGASLLIESTGLIGTEAAYTLHLYSATPGSALADNAAWDLPSGDRASYLGSISLGTPVDVGSTLYIRTDQINMQILAASADVYGYLVTVGAYTPTSARVYRIGLNVVGL